MTLPGWGQRVLLLAIVPVSRQRWEGDQSITYGIKEYRWSAVLLWSRKHEGAI